jgi:uncharacterized surface protein with fasciclin (FAS1) repeats
MMLSLLLLLVVELWGVLLMFGGSHDNDSSSRFSWQMINTIAAPTLSNSTTLSRWLRRDMNDTNINNILLGNYVTTEKNDSNLSVFAMTMEVAHLISFLNTNDIDVVVLAPTNPAFANDMDGVWWSLVASSPSWRLHLRTILLNHVILNISSDVPFLNNTITNRHVLHSLANGTITIFQPRNGDLSIVNDADGTEVNVVRTISNLRNGIIYVVDSMLLPSFISKTVFDIVNANVEYSFFVSALQSIDAVDLLFRETAVTVFAPTNDAFAKLEWLNFIELSDLSTIVGRHIVHGVWPTTIFDINTTTTLETLSDDSYSLRLRKMNVQGGVDGTTDVVVINDMATIIESNMLAYNGIVHGTNAVFSNDGVIIPTISPSVPSFVSVTPSLNQDQVSSIPTNASPWPNHNNNVSILDRINNNASLRTVARILQLTGLNTTLADDDDTNTSGYIVLAPYDEAFNQLPTAFLTNLLSLPWEIHLLNLINYHVANVTKQSPTLVNSTTYTMLNNETVAVDKGQATITLVGNSGRSNTTVISAVAEATNEGLYLLDSVLLPSFVDRTLLDACQKRSQTMSLLLVAAGLELFLTTGSVSYTMFAPTDAAFSALPINAYNFLTDPSNVASLTTVLTNHLIRGVVPSTFLHDGDVYLALSGNEVVVTRVDAEFIMINDANVVHLDELSRDGLVHNIDRVIVPPDISTTLTPSGSPVPTPIPTLVDRALTSHGERWLWRRVPTISTISNAIFSLIMQL